MAQKEQEAQTAVREMLVGYTETKFHSEIGAGLRLMQPWGFCRSLVLRDPCGSANNALSNTEASPGLRRRLDYRYPATFPNLNSLTL